MADTVEKQGVVAPSDQIEITPEMIAAGIAAIASCHYPHADPDSWEGMASDVYRAMRLARPSLDI
jgi:hypothetical protein